MRIIFLFLFSFAFILVVTAPACTTDVNPPDVYPPDAYPTDVCVMRKLWAAAKACDQCVDAYALDALRVGQSKLTANLDRAVQDLIQSFEKADTSATADSVDCSQTTLSGEAMAEKIRSGAGDLATTVESALDLQQPGDRIAAFVRLKAAAMGCAGLVTAEAKQIETRSSLRDRSVLERQRAKALARFRAVYGFFQWGSKVTAPDPSALQIQLLAFANEIALGTIISPNVAMDWTMVTPDASVPYLGAMLDPSCARGTPWVYFVKRGSNNKLLIYYQGGGACWDYLTCALLPVYKSSAGPNDNPANVRAGLANLANPANPFREWNFVFVPYCTGDVHWGDAAVNYLDPLGSDSSVDIRHKGRVNAAVAEKWAREHFVDPEEVFVTGSSAGAYGAILNSIYLQENVYPSSPFTVLGDAGNGVITQDFLMNNIAKWGVEKTFPSWIPELAKPLTELDPGQLWSAPARYYPAARFATYSTAYDGGTGGQTGFYQVMRNPLNTVAWLQWWQSSCDWHDIMRQQNLAAAAAAPNFRYYIGTGSRHTVWGSDKVYTDTTGGVPLLVDWVTAMRDGTTDWTNVECQDCGLLLPGDPKPNPIQSPFIDDGANGRVVCTVP
jgi:hypothetical protein